MNYQPSMAPSTVLKGLLKHRTPKPMIHNTEYLQVRHKIFEWMFDAGTKLKFSLNTIHLGVFFLDHFMNYNPSAVQSINLYATTALLVAAKSGELDERVPFVSKLLRVTGVSFPVADIKAAELRICDSFNWNLQNSTLIDILEFYLTQGVIFSNDEFEDDILGGKAEDAGVLKERNQNLNGNEPLPSAKGRKIFGNDEKSRFGIEYDTTHKHERNLQAEGKVYELVSAIERRAFKLATLIIRGNTHLMLAVD